MGITVTTQFPGDGVTFPRQGDIVTVEYRGTLEDGSVFDSTYERGYPFRIEIGVGKVIRGFDEGLMRMSLGQKATIQITPDLAYGARGFHPTIPPNATLRFEAHLMKIN